MSNINQQLQQLIDKESGKTNTHAVLLGVQSGDGQVNFQGGAGGVSPDSPYFIASITKMFTASVVMQLVDEENLIWTHPFNSICHSFSWMVSMFTRMLITANNSKSINSFIRLQGWQITTKMNLSRTSRITEIVNTRSTMY